jgi:hypothetical protein
LEEAARFLEKESRLIPQVRKLLLSQRSIAMDAWRVTKM